jgi:hypothetical protein
MGAVALVLEDGRAAVPVAGEGREDVRELRARGLVEGLEAAGLEPLDVLVERIDEDPEGQLALELRGACREHEPALVVGTARQLAEQPRLADARLAHQLDGTRSRPLQRREGLVNRPQLSGTPDELRCRLGHSSRPGGLSIQAVGAPSGEKSGCRLREGSGCRRAPARRS